MSEPPTSDQLRHAIDSGKTGEKVPFPDPAAAPLGTDAEAAGYPPTKSELAMEARTPVGPAHQRPRNLMFLYVSIIAAIALAAIWIVSSG
jgi:hypothetical protein